MTDWMDEVLDGKPLEAEMWKIGYIENLLHRTAISTSEQSEILNSLDILTDIDADKILKKIKEYEINTDPKDQYEEMRKNGMFNS
jgi:tetrahydromethanopterin S-methyltransferase subunit A